MALSVTAYPQANIVWTKNPMKFTWTYSSMQTNWWLQVHFIDGWTGAIIAEMAYPFTSTGGTIDIYAEKVLDPYFQYQANTNMTSNIPQLLNAGGIVYLEFRPYGVDLPVQNWQPFFHPTYEFWSLMKGGYGDLQTSQEAGINNLNLPSSFISYVPSGRLMMPKEFGQIMYFSATDISQLVTWRCTYASGISVVHTYTMSIPVGVFYGMANKFWMIPIGLQQIGMPLLYSGIYPPVSMTITITTVGSGVVTLATYLINFDNRPYWKTLTLYYRNSRGGLDHIRLKGDIVSTIESQKLQAEQSRVLPNNLDGPSADFDSKVIISYKGNTGYITRQHQLAALELYNTTYAFLVDILGRAYPVRIPPQKLDYTDTQPGLYSLSIQFEIAATFKVFPQDLDVFNNVFL